MKEFLQNLDLGPEVFEDHNLILVNQQNGANGNFILQYLLAEFAERFDQNSRILLILTHNSIVHWTSVCGKLGLNLQSLIDKGRVCVIDNLRDLYQTQKRLFRGGPGDSEDSVNPSPFRNLLNPQNGKIDLPKLVLQCSDYLKGLGKERPLEKSSLAPDQKNDTSSTGASKAGSIKNKEEEIEKDRGDPSVNEEIRKVLIILEDISDIHYENLSSTSNPNSANDKLFEKSTIEFLLSLMDLNSLPASSSTSSATASFGKYDLSIATSVNSRADFFSQIISNSLASLSFDISLLPTGASQQINGLLRVKRSSKGLKSAQDRWIKSFHYKLEDRAVKIQIT